MIHRSARKRIRFRDTLAPGVGPLVWPQLKEVGWAKVPRTISVLLAVVRLNSPKGLDPAGAYLDLLSRNMGEGLVEITSEVEHAMLSGLSGTNRGVRSWRERLRALSELGFVRLFPAGGPRVDQVVLLHPTSAMTALRDAGKVRDDLWTIFQRMVIDFSSEPIADAIDLPPLDSSTASAPPVPA